MASYVTLIQNFARFETSESGTSVSLQTYDSANGTWYTQWALNTATGQVTVTGAQTVSGDQTVVGTQTVDGAAAFSSTVTVTDALTAGSVNPNVAVQSLAGETGTVYYVQPFGGTGYKKVLLWFDSYENDTATAQTIPFPTAFVTVAGITSNTSGLTLSTSLTELTITAPDTSTIYIGFAVVEGW